MAASTSKNTLQRPQDKHLPASPGKVKRRNIRKVRRKGKDDEGDEPLPARAPPSGAGEKTVVAEPLMASTSATKDNDGSWSWISITDSSASRHPPIFTKDGRYAFDSAVIAYCRAHAVLTTPCLSATFSR